ncbi:hypothetical protein SRHO_G00294120 [Serrasalmus rhombeus]
MKSEGVRTEDVYQTLHQPPLVKNPKHKPVRSSRAPTLGRMEMSECVKTEDVYQTLHQPPPVKNPNPAHGSPQSSRLITILLIFNSVLLIIILVLTGTFIAKDHQNAEVSGSQTSGEEANKPRNITGLVSDENKEAWLHHDDSFYLIWEAEGNCTEAAKFCKAKGSSIRLAVLTQWNQDWLITQTKGRRLLVAEDECLTSCKLIDDPKLLEMPSNPGEEQGWKEELQFIKLHFSATSISPEQQKTLNTPVHQRRSK